MWWNWPAVHGVWKSATAARAWIAIVGMWTSTYSSPALTAEPRYMQTHMSMYNMHMYMLHVVVHVHVHVRICM